MLNEEIQRQKGEFSEKIENVEIILLDQGFIPENYIQNEEKLNIYRRFATLSSNEELKDLVFEIKDRFGKIPESLKKFILSIKFKLFAQKNKIKRIFEIKNGYKLYFVENCEKEIKNLSKKIKIKKVESLEILGENKKNLNEENFVVIEVLKKEFLEVVKRGEKL